MVAFFFFRENTFLAGLDLIMEACLVYEATRVPFFFVKGETKTGPETGAAGSPCSLSWTDFFNLEIVIGGVLEAGMEGAMVGSPSWMSKVMRVGMTQKVE